MSTFGPPTCLNIISLLCQVDSGKGARWTCPNNNHLSPGTAIPAEECGMLNRAVSSALGHLMPLVGCWNVADVYGHGHVEDQADSAHPGSS